MYWVPGSTGGWVATSSISAVAAGFPWARRSCSGRSDTIAATAAGPLLLSWVPVIGDPLTLVAGIMRESCWSFLLIVGLARRSATWSWLRWCWAGPAERFVGERRTIFRGAMSIAARCNCRLIAPGPLVAAVVPGLSLPVSGDARCAMTRVVAGSLVCLLLGSAPAWASTAEAWQAHDAMVRAACLKASGLRQVRAVGQVLPFDDEVGYSALLLQGRYPQPHMQGRQGRELCLYRRATGKASVSEADALLKP